MKKLIVITILLTTISIFSQDISVYQDGKINLKEDNSFGENTNWNQIFNESPRINRLRDNISVASDGTMFVSNYNDCSISILGSNGEYKKSFGKMGWNRGEFINTVALQGVKDNLYLITSDGQGRIQFFDFTGNLWKLVSVDYSVRSVIPLENNKIAILGFVVTTNGWKDIISIKDLVSNNEKIIWSKETNEEDVEGKSIKIRISRDEINKKIFEERILTKLDDKSKSLISSYYKLNDSQSKYILDSSKASKNIRELYSLLGMAGYWTGIFTYSNPLTKEEYILKKLLDGNLILGITTSPELYIISPEGNQIRTIQTGIEPVRITENDKELFYQNTLNSLKKDGFDPSYAEKIKEDGFFPENLPYYYDMVTDSNGNLLLFTYTEEKPEYRFSVLTISPDKKIIGNCLLDSNEYLINLSPLINNKTIVNNSIYFIAGISNNNKKSIKIIKALME